MYGVAVGVGKYLHLNMTRTNKGFFQNQITIAKCAFSFALSFAYGQIKVLHIRNLAHAHAAAARRRFDHQRKANRLRSCP